MTTPTPSSSPDPDDLDFGATLKGLRPGLKLFRRFSLERQLGRGGMGVVWLGSDEHLGGREVALKFLPELVQGDESAIVDLKKETLRSLELTHPNIVRIYDWVADEYLAAISMEYVDGSTLSGLRVRTEAGVFEVPEITAWTEQLCAALTYAHGRKIVHRDLKPSNLMIDGEGRLRVMDFGIAGSLTDSMSRLTRISHAGRC
jgi:serine/threonine protein kinase